jgi:aspartate aminotransferase-like enzyme
MFRIGSMGETPIEEMIEGCKRMITCFNEMGLDLPISEVESHFER